MLEKWLLYQQRIKEIVDPFIDKNIIIFGFNQSAMCLKRFLESNYNKQIKAIIDLWERSTSSTVLHLYSFFYLYDDNDIILNVTDLNVIEEFEKCGERWCEVRYNDSQIVNVISELYGEETKKSIDYYDWLEYNYDIDFTDSIRRAYLDGEDAHGYYPTEHSVLEKILRDYDIDIGDAAFDFGCGKGAIMTTLNQFGFSKVGGWNIQSRFIIF